jgi:GGDEF domain-containing protein
MSRSLRLSTRFRPPRHEAPAGAVEANHRLILGTLGLTVVAEGVMAVLFSPVAGGLMFASSGVLGFLTGRSQRLARAEVTRTQHPLLGHLAKTAYADMETGLPTQQPLVEQITRDIARAERHQEPLTLAIIRITRVQGDPADPLEVVRHVAETLKRVTRASDYLARIEEFRFAALLADCPQDNAAIFAERATVAIANQPLLTGERPAYVHCDVGTLQYNPERHRGALGFLREAVANGRIEASASSESMARLGELRADGGHALRRQLLNGAQGGQRPIQTRPTDGPAQ